MNSCELDRHPTTGINPLTLKPMSNKVVIKRELGREKVGSIIVPDMARERRPLFQGTVVSMGKEKPYDYKRLCKGDRVFFSYQVGGDDSAFMIWEGEHYAVVPWESIQAVLS